MDPYIINNMPDDSDIENAADIDLAFALDTVEVALSYDGTSYILTISEFDEARQGGDIVTTSVVAAFDPILTLGQCMAIMRVFSVGELSAASKAAAALLGMEPEADQG